MTERHTVYPRVLVFLFNQDDVLLIKRSTDACLFPGLYNGVGGHVERGEDVLSAAQREVGEETGLNTPNLRLRCILHADEGPDKPGVLVFVLTGRVERRDVTSSSEGTLHWVPLTQVSRLNAMPDLVPLLSRIASLPAEAAPIFARSTIPPDGDTNGWQIRFRPF